MGQSEECCRIVEVLNHFARNDRVELAEMTRVVINSEVVKLNIRIRLARDSEAIVIRFNARHFESGFCELGGHCAVAATDVDDPLAPQTAEMAFDRPRAVVDGVHRLGGFPAIAML